MPPLKRSTIDVDTELDNCVFSLEEECNTVRTL